MGYELEVLERGQEWKFGEWVGAEGEMNMGV